MSCEEYEKSISALIDGELEGSQLTKVQAHLDGCKSCQATMKATQAVKKLVSEKMHREVAPVHLRARIRRELDKESAKLPLWSKVARIFTYNPVPAFAVAALLLIAVGFGIGRFTVLPSDGSIVVTEGSELGTAITLQGRLVCINCELHGHEGNPVFCKEHNHVLGVKLADGSIWSILDNKEAEGLRSRYADMNKTFSIEGVAFPGAKYIELRKFKLI